MPLWRWLRRYHDHPVYYGPGVAAVQDSVGLRKHRLALLLVVCVMGNTAFGAQLSINIGGFSFQPSEFVKISFVFFVATMFYRSVDFRTIAITTAVAAAHVLVLVMSKDLGTR